MRLRDLLLAAIAGVAACVAGVGLLYLLRRAHVGDVGPLVSRALPLEQLARADAQPLLRVAVAWAAAGVAAGVVLGVLTRSRLALEGVVLVATAWVVLVVSAAVSDAIANNASVTFGRPLSAAGTWVSLALLVIGVAPGLGLGARAARAPSDA